MNITSVSEGLMDHGGIVQPAGSAPASAVAIAFYIIVRRSKNHHLTEDAIANEQKTNSTSTSVKKTRLSLH